jgi:hypothetical protein
VTHGTGIRYRLRWVVPRENAKTLGDGPGTTFRISVLRAPGRPANCCSELNPPAGIGGKASPRGNGTIYVRPSANGNSERDNHLPPGDHCKLILSLIRTGGPAQGKGISGCRFIARKVSPSHDPPAVRRNSAQNEDRLFDRLLHPRTIRPNTVSNPVVPVGAPKEDFPGPKSGPPALHTWDRLGWRFAFKRR